MKNRFKLKNNIKTKSMKNKNNFLYMIKVGNDKQEIIDKYAFGKIKRKKKKRKTA